MTHIINKLYVIISYFLCCKRQTKYKNKQYTMLTVPLRCVKIMQEIIPGQSVVVKILIGDIKRCFGQ